MMDHTEIYENFASFMEEFAEESDRGCAVLTLCVLEEALSKAIRRRLPDAPNNNGKDLWKNFAPKGRLSVTVANAYMLGILNKTHLMNFQKLIDVRNKFAHQALKNLKFSDTQIANWTRDLQLGDKGIKLEGRQRFMISAGEIYFTLGHLEVEKILPLRAEGRTLQLIPIPSEAQ